MKTQHTPGPWSVFESCGSTFIITGDQPEEADTVAKVWNSKARPGRARLIAAAPELLDALENLRKQLRDHIKLDVKKHYSLMVADAAAGTAIHKARGEP